MSNSEGIDQLAENFKTVKELRQYCSSQYRVIISLNKKIVQLEEETKHLKELIAKSTPILDATGGTLEVYKNVTDELAVCLIQIKLLRDRCANGTELSYEEAKKLDIYTKLLIQLKTGEKPEENVTKTLTDDELLKLLNSEMSKDETSKNG
jgi:hypothetical protein